MAVLLLFASLFFSEPVASAKSDQIVGKWMSDRKDLLVEVFKTNHQYAARIVWFECRGMPMPKLDQYFDTLNPNPKLRARPWVGMEVVSRLTFDGQDEWRGGILYDPNSGKTYRSFVRLNSPRELKIRGYWGIELLGRDMIFKKVNP